MNIDNERYPSLQPAALAETISQAAKAVKAKFDQATAESAAARIFDHYKLSRPPLLTNSREWLEDCNSQQRAKVRSAAWALARYASLDEPWKPRDYRVPDREANCAVSDWADLADDDPELEELRRYWEEHHAAAKIEGEREAAEVQAQADRAASLVAGRPESFHCSDDPESIKEALLAAVKNHPGELARDVVQRLQGLTNPKRAFAILGELEADEDVWIERIRGKQGTMKFHHPKDEFDGLLLRELASHPANVNGHQLGISTIAYRIGKLKMRPSAALSLPRNKSHKGVRIRRQKATERLEWTG